MRFAEPLWLFAGLLVIAAMFWIYRRFDLRQRAALAEFASNHLLAKLTASFSPTRRLVKRGLFVAALVFIFGALARPQWGFHWEEEKQRGIDILFAIDTSKSMLTQDVTPDRLTRAKMAIEDLVNKIQGDRVGLIAFAGDAFLQAPLTLDYDAFRETLDAIDTGTIPRGGTDISSAIQEAQVAFGNESKSRKILVLLTDGEDLEAKGIDSARAAAKNGMVIYTVGVGTASGGLIPVPGANGGTDFVKDSAGEFVKSHLDENTLKQIAEATGGMYQPLGQQGQGLQAIYDQALAPLPKQDLASKRQKVYEERFQWPLSAALLCLLASLMIGTRRRDRKNSPKPVRAVKTAAAASILALMAFMSSAQASVQSAEDAYKKGDYTDAEKEYEKAANQHPDAPPLNFNLGASAYKTQQYDKALPAFQKALNSEEVPVQQQAYYDMGNTQYRLGQKTEKSAPQDTIKTWESAVQSYDSALKLKPDDADAKFNRDFVQKKLDQLKKQNPQKNDQQKQDQKNQDQKDQQQQQSDSQQNQNQKNQDQDKQQQQSNSQQNQNQQDQNQQGQNNQQNQQQSGSQQDQKNDQANPQKQNQSQGDQAKQDQKQSGSQQSEAQNGNQDRQDQNGQQGQPKDQQTAGNQDQQMSGDQKNQQTAQNNPKQAGQTIPDKDQSKSQAQGAQAETAAPGELTKEEARQLLDSLKNGEHTLQAVADARNTATHPQDQPPLKDW